MNGPNKDMAPAKEGNLGTSDEKELRCFKQIKPVQLLNKKKKKGCREQGVSLGGLTSSKRHPWGKKRTT